MAEIKIEQFPDDDVTEIEGTLWGNDLLRALGQSGIARGPFVVERRADGFFTLRIVSEWPEKPAAEDEGKRGVAKLREASQRIALSRATLYITEDGRTRRVDVDGMKLPNVAAARTEHLPEQVARLVVEILVGDVETIEVANDWREAAQ